MKRVDYNVIIIHVIERLVHTLSTNCYTIFVYRSKRFKAKILKTERGMQVNKEEKKKRELKLKRRAQLIVAILTKAVRDIF